MNSLSIKRLRQSVQQFFNRFEAQRDEILYAKFTTNLFTENWQKTAFYFQQIEQTLTQLEKLNIGNTEALQFYTQKLSAQCSALSDALTRQRQNTRLFPSKTKEQNKTNKRNHPVHSLPPRERLAKYYDYLSEFNEKIQLEQDLQGKAQRENLTFSKDKLTQLQQRRARCLEAIEMLEEYLIFVQNQQK